MADAVYLHFGGPETLQRIAEDKRYKTTLTDEAINATTTNLAKQNEKARMQRLLNAAR